MPSRSQHRYLPISGVGRVLVAAGLTSIGVIGNSSVAGAASAPPVATGWLRVGHFSPSTGPVDVYVNQTEVAQSLAYQAVTPYQSEPVGTYTVALRIASAPATAAPLVSVSVNVTAGGAETVAAITGSSGPTLTAIPDNLAPPPSGQAEVRVVALDAAATALNASLTPLAGSGPVSFGPLAYGAAANYQAVGAGTYNLSVSTPSGMKLIAGTDWPVAAGSVASIVVATSAGKPTIEVLRDATGASVMPAGAAKTGLGGTALWGQGGERWWSWLALGGAASTLIMAAGAATMRRRRGLIPVPTR